MSFQVTNPFQIFIDGTGSPLEDGYVYIGTENLNPETNPVSIYWDSALTIPAANPVRTINGYLSRNGSPGNIYTSTKYSIMAKDKTGQLVYSRLSAGAYAGSASSINFDLTGKTVEAGATQQVDTIAALRAIPVVAGIYIYLKEHTAGVGKGGGFFGALTGAAPGAYTDDNGFTIIPTGGDGSSCWRRKVQGAVSPQMAGAHSAASSAVNTAAIQAAIDFLPTTPAIKTNTAANLAARDLSGGGTVDCLRESLQVNNTILVPANVHLTGLGGLSPDPLASWAQADLDCVDVITVTNGGAGYSNIFSVTCTGGGGTTQAMATGYAIAGVIQFIVVNSEGAGYTSAPTVDLSAGGGAGGAATAVIKKTAKPLIKEKSQADAFATFGIRVSGTLLCGNICDGIELNVAAASDFKDLTIHDPLYDGIRYIACDINSTYGVKIYGGDYGIYGKGSATNGCNEIEHYNAEIKYQRKACIRTTSSGLGCQSWRIVGGSFIANIGGSEIVLGGASGSHTLVGPKFEHDGANTSPLVLLANGQCHTVDMIVAPRASTVHYKLIHNSGANSAYATVSTTAPFFAARVDNPVMPNDISPFQSDVSQGLYVLRPPFNTSAKLTNITDWCRDQTGASQTSPSFVILQAGKGLSLNIRTERMDFEGTVSTGTVQRCYVVGDTVARGATLATGEVRLSSGSATADIRAMQRTTVQTTNATATTMASLSIAAGQVVTWRALVQAKDAANAKHAAYEVIGSAYLLAGVATLIGSPTAVSTQELDATMNCTFDVSGAAIRLRVTGVAATTIDWLSLSEVMIR